MHLFVYGTLRRSAAHPMHVPLREAARLVGHARVRGVLYRVASYPGLVLEAGGGWVMGELYQLRDLAVLEPLDAYEGAAPHDPEPREFERVRAVAHRLDGGEQEAWVYAYRWPTAGLEIIASGDFSTERSG